VEPLRRALEQTLINLSTVAKNEENLIDKRLVSKLLITFMSNNSKKNEVLQLIAKILNFTQEEKEAIGLHNSHWSLVPFFGNSTSDKTPSLTDLWVDFLLKETAELSKQGEKS